MEKIDVNIGEVHGNELIIRQGKAPDKVEFPTLSITGKVGTVLEYLKKYPELVLDNNSFIEVNPKTMITLVINPFLMQDIFSKEGKVCSIIRLSDEVISLQFNSKFWTSKELGDFLRFNQHILSATNTDIKGIIARLRNFEVEYSKKFKDTKDASGNAEFTKSQVITKCNIPPTIDFSIPLFKGDEKVSITAEVEIDPDSLKCILIVPGFTQLVEERGKYLIDEEVKAIRELEVGNKLPIIYLNEE